MTFHFDSIEFDKYSPEFKKVTNELLISVQALQSADSDDQLRVIQEKIGEFARQVTAECVSDPLSDIAEASSNILIELSQFVWKLSGEIGSTKSQVYNLLSNTCIALRPPHEPNASDIELTKLMKIVEYIYEHPDAITALEDAIRKYQDAEEALKSSTGIDLLGELNLIMRKIADDLKIKNLDYSALLLKRFVFILDFNRMLYPGAFEQVEDCIDRFF